MSKKNPPFFLIKFANGVTRALVWSYVLIILNAFLLVLSTVILEGVVRDRDSANSNFFLAVNICQITSLLILIFMIAYTFRKNIIPLNTAEKMLIDSYKEIVGDARVFIKLNKDINIDKIVDTVMSRHRESWNRELTANMLRQEARLAELQSQINPHFLYNTLESIRGFALMKKVPEIAQMTEALALLFRSNTRKIGAMIPFEDEIKNIENYILIQKFRFMDRFSLEINIYDSIIDILKCKIPSFLLQPIVENAIYHGLESIPSKGQILLQAYCTQSKLIIQINDNGLGMPDEKLRELNEKLSNNTDPLQLEDKNQTSTGIGLVNINQRIKMQFGNDYGITLASTLKIGTQVEIVLPFII